MIGYTLLQPKAERRHALESSFHFLCQCDRCSVDDEPTLLLQQCDAWFKDVAKDKKTCQGTLDNDIVYDACDRLMQLWREECRLPAMYPLMYILLRKVAGGSTAETRAIAHVCGFRSLENERINKEQVHP